MRLYSKTVATKDRIAQIKLLRAEGRNSQEIASVAGCSRSTVERVLRGEYDGASTTATEGRRAAHPPSAPPPPPPPPPPPIRNESFLRKRIADLESETRKLRVERESQDEFYNRVVAAVATQEPYPSFVMSTPKDTKDRKAVVPILVLSDWHCGEVIKADEVEGVNAFDWNTLMAGVFSLLDDFLRWVEVNRSSYPIEECAVFCLGDYVSGDIHDELRVTNEWPLPVQTAKAGTLLGEVFRILAGRFKKVTAYEVGADNHGRLVRRPQAKQKASNSMSYLVQHIANASAANCNNFEPIVATGAKLIAPVNGYRFLLEHGDNLQSWMGIPFYGIQRSAGREALKRMNQPSLSFDYYCIGHFHTPCWDQRRIILNGSMSGTSEYDHACGRDSLPAQVAGLVHPSYGIFNFTPFLRADVKDRLRAERAPK